MRLGHMWVRLVIWVLSVAISSASEQEAFRHTYTVDKCSICTAVAETIEFSLTRDEWEDNTADKRAGKKFSIRESRALEVLDGLCERMMFKDADSSVRDQLELVRFAMVVKDGVGRFVRPEPDPVTMLAKFDGEVDRSPGANQPLYSLCGVLLEEFDESLMQWLMQGKAKQIESRLCVDGAEMCNRTELKGHVPGKCFEWEKGCAAA